MPEQGYYSRYRYQQRFPYLRFHQKHALIILNRVERVISTELRVVVARVSMSKGIAPTSYRVLTQNGGCRGLIDSYVIETIFSSAGISLSTQIKSYG